ncbi:adenylosuccinate lyase, partial [candidate division WOR-3 bacterium]|nr:adenylosuccinate lyase [candidate division WOR-3 bacterium]
IEDASSLIIKDTELVIDILKKRAKEFKDTIMVGRTHGVHAEPITFGFKLCVWMDEMRRNLKRIKSVKEELRVGKISGACGTYPILSPEVEIIALERLGLRVAPISTQILQRDRHANYLSVLAVIASSLENFTVQIRLMQQTERGEVREPFSRGQRGSSAMPHKQNPIISERISGLARVVRSNALSSMQNMALWDERDISHSSVERIIIPDSTILLDYILNKFRYIIENLDVDKKRMYENLEMSKGLVFSQTVRLALIEKGMSPDDAYNIIQRAAFRSKEEDRKFKEILLDEKEIRNYLSAEELDTCFDTKKVLKNISYILDRFGI